MSDFVCSECGSRLSRVKSEVSFVGGERREKSHVAPCGRCVEAALADRGAFVIVRKVSIGGAVESLLSEDEVGYGGAVVAEEEPERVDYVLAHRAAFVSASAAGSALARFVADGESDASGMPFEYDTHEVVRLGRGR